MSYKKHSRTGVLAKLLPRRVQYQILYTKTMNENRLSPPRGLSPPCGIIIFGLNGSGKTTLGRELARVLDFWSMDIEDYHFEKSEIPYTAERSREDCLSLMLSDIKNHRSFVISAVTGDFGDEILSYYKLAVYLTAPADIRIARVKKRAYERYGNRVCEGGDMYEKNARFIDFASSRTSANIDNWAKTLICPVLQIDGLTDIKTNAENIAKYWKYLNVEKTNKQDLN